MEGGRSSGQATAEGRAVRDRKAVRGLREGPDPAESNDLKELLDVSREYLIALRVKSAMAEAGAQDVGRGLELAAYFTHCNLQPSHLMLALKTAMASAFKNKVR